MAIFFQKKIKEINIHNTIGQILENMGEEKDITTVSGITEWSNEFQKRFHLQKIFFHITPLRCLLNKAFPNILHYLADDVNLNVELKVHWNL